MQIKKVIFMNIVMILTDQMHKYAMGNKRDYVHTPNIDQLATDGVVFNSAYSCSPVCGPYRGNLFTGMHTIDNRVIGNGDSLPNGVETLAESLNEAGYQTSFVGKWHLGNKGNCPIPEKLRGGFSNFIGYQCYNGFNNNVCFYDENNQEHCYHQHRTDVTTNIAIDRLKMLAENEKPFLHVVFYQAPHYPEQPSEKYEALYKDTIIPYPPNYREVDPFTPTGSPFSPRPIENDPDYQRYGNNMQEYQKLYYGMVSQIDNGVGKLMQTIDKLGIKDDTVVIFSSDHGDMQGSHGLLNKCLPYEESCGVPLIITQPNGQCGASVDTPVSTIDFYPTCLEYACQSPMESKPGRSLVPLITGEKMELDDDIPVFAEIRIGNIEDHWIMIRTKQYKMTVTVHSKQPYLLFDMLNDPYEMNNLVNEKEYAPIKKSLMNKILEWEGK